MVNYDLNLISSIENAALAANFAEWVPISELASELNLKLPDCAIGLTVISILDSKILLHFDTRITFSLKEGLMPCTVRTLTPEGLKFEKPSHYFSWVFPCEAKPCTVNQTSLVRVK